MHVQGAALHLTRNNTVCRFCPTNFRHSGNQYASERGGNVDGRPSYDNGFLSVVEQLIDNVNDNGEDTFERYDGGREDNGDVEKAEDAQGYPKAARKRDHTANVHEGGHSLVQEGQHHHQRARAPSKPGGLDIQNAGGHDKTLAAKVVLQRSLSRVPVEGECVHLYPFPCRALEKFPREGGNCA